MVKDCCEDNGHKVEEHHAPKLEKSGSSKNIGAYIMLALVAVLLVFALVQTVQINSIGDRIASGSVSVASAAGSGAPSAPQAARASPAQAPTMVGGC